MKTILVPLDGSALAEQVLLYAREIAALLGAEVRLVRALTDAEPDNVYAETMMGVYGVAKSPEAYREPRQRAWAELRQHTEGYLTTRVYDLKGLVPPQ